MRRKSDRKSKTSPEKKTAEAPATRRSHRRRRHASSSPEREEHPPSDVENEGNDGPPKLEPMTPLKIEGSNSNSEEEKQEERPVWQVKSAETPAGGEIQKLKICLARPSSTPERLDKSPRRHRKHRGGTSLSQTDEDSSEEKVKSAKLKKHNDCVESSEEKVNRIVEDHNSSDSQQVSSTDIDDNSKPNEKEEKQGEFIEEQVGTSQDVAPSGQVYNGPEDCEMKAVPDSNENPDQSAIEDTLDNKVNGDEEMGSSNDEESKVEQVEEEPERSTTPEPRKEHSKTPELPKPSSTQSPETPEERSHTPEALPTRVEEPVEETQVIEPDEEESVEETRSETPEIQPGEKFETKPTEVQPNQQEVKPTSENVVENNVKSRQLQQQVSHETNESSNGDASPIRSSVVSVSNQVQSSEVEPVEESTYVADPARKKIKLKETVLKYLTTPNYLTSEYVQEVIPDLQILSLDEIKLEDEIRPPPELEERKTKKRPFEDKKITIQNVKEFIATPPTSNPLLTNRKISIVGEEINSLNRPPSPAKNEISPVLYIRNLVRPFTLNQLRELLSRTGTITENGFWINKIKSECYVQYESEEQSVETRNALHGVHWPVANGRRLDVDFGTEEAMEQARAPTEVKKEIKTQTPEKEIKPKEEAVDWREERERERLRREQRGVREWDVGKHGQQRTPSPSPPKRRHQSPPSRHSSPERKTKKKEDVPSKLLDDLFRKTKATPCIYWLPLSAEMIVVKEEQRRKHMAEHERRLAEIRRVERMRRPSGRGRDNRGRYD